MMIVNKKKSLNKLMKELKVYQLFKIFKKKMILLTNLRKKNQIKIMKIRIQRINKIIKFKKNIRLRRKSILRNKQ